MTSLPDGQPVPPCAGQQPVQQETRKRSASEAALDSIPNEHHTAILKDFVSKDDLNRERILFLKADNERSKFVEELLTATRKVGHLEKERAQVFQDAAMLYKRGVVELQLHLFIGIHNKVEEKRFRCDGQWFPKNFSQTMAHWRKCKKHKSQPKLITAHGSGLMRIAADQSMVEGAIDQLYAALSGPAHFNLAEHYPIRIHPFPNNPPSTLALLTFLTHYDVPFEVMSPPPLSEAKAAEPDDAEDVR